MNKIKKEIRLFKLLEKLKKRDLFNHINNVNLLNEELEKTDQLLSKINNMKRLYLAIRNMGIIETDLLNKLPIFVVLNELSFNDLVLFKRLAKIGYNRVLHLKFLENESIKLIKDQKVYILMTKTI